MSHSSLWVSLSTSARQVELTPDFCLPSLLCEEEAKSPPMCFLGGAPGDFLTQGKINLMQSARRSLPPEVLSSPALPSSVELQEHTLQYSVEWVVAVSTEMRNSRQAKALEPIPRQAQTRFPGLIWGSSGLPSRLLGF